MEERRAAIFAKIDPPKQVVLPQPRFWHATHAFVARDGSGKQIGAGSCFAVSFDRNDAARKRCYVATATHNIHGAVARGLERVEMLVRRMPDRATADPLVWETAAVAIPLDSWAHGGTDVSVAPLPVDALPDDLYMETVAREDFLDRKPVAIITAADIDLYGRWGMRGERDHVILRRGVLASFERPTVTLDVTPGVETRGAVYVVDANVSKGMSGGLAIANVGGGEMQQGVLGLIHGTQRLLEDDLREASVNDDEKKIRERLIKEMEIINGRIVYVIPFNEVVTILDDLDARLTRA